MSTGGGGGARLAVGLCVYACVTVHKCTWHSALGSCWCSTGGTCTAGCVGVGGGALVTKHVRALCFYFVGSLHGWAHPATLCECAFLSSFGPWAKSQLPAHGYCSRALCCRAE
jgi:hypothetical protein